MILKKIIPAILYLCVAPSALSGETSDLVTGTITVKECKKIKVHKKLEGTEVPPAKK